MFLKSTCGVSVFVHCMRKKEVEWLKICAINESPSQAVGKLPDVADLIVLVILLILVIFDGASWVNSDLMLLLLLSLLPIVFLVVQQNHCAATAKITRGLLVLLYRQQRSAATMKTRAEAVKQHSNVLIDRKVIYRYNKLYCIGTYQRP